MAFTTSPQERSVAIRGAQEYQAYIDKLNFRRGEQDASNVGLREATVYGGRGGGNAPDLGEQSEADKQAADKQVVDKQAADKQAVYGTALYEGSGGAYGTRGGVTTTLNQPNPDFMDRFSKKPTESWAEWGLNYLGQLPDYAFDQGVKVIAEAVKLPIHALYRPGDSKQDVIAAINHYRDAAQRFTSGRAGTYLYNLATGTPPRNAVVEDRSVTAQTPAPQQVAAQTPAPQQVAGQTPAPQQVAQPKIAKAGMFSKSAKASVAKDIRTKPIKSLKVPRSMPSIQISSEIRALQSLQQVLKQQMYSAIYVPGGITKIRGQYAATSVMIDDLLVLEGINRFKVNNNPELLAQVLTHQLGRPIQIGQASADTWYFIDNGRTLKERWTKKEILKRMTRLASTDTDKALDAAAVGAASKRDMEILKSLLSINKVHVEKAYDIVLKKYDKAGLHNGLESLLKMELDGSVWIKDLITGADGTDRPTWVKIVGGNTGSTVQPRTKVSK